MELDQVVLLVGILGAALLAALVTAPPIDLVVRGGCGGGPLRSGLEARAALGALVLRHRPGALELRLLGMRLWRWRSKRPLRRRLLSRLGDREGRARLRRWAELSGPRLRAAAAHWALLLELAWRLVALLRVRVRLEGTVGLDDPADTVLLFEALRHVEARLQRWELCLTRDYFNETVVLDARVSLRVFPVSLALFGARVMLRREVWRLLRQLARPAPARRSP